MPGIIRFDCFEVDLVGGQIYRRGTRLPLREQSFRVLAALVERPGQVVTRDELRHRLWPDDVFVDFDNILNSSVARLREVLHDSADRPRFIETVPRRGYRFIAPVSRAPEAEATPSKNPRLLVLPLVNSSGDEGEEYFSDAMTGEIITSIADLAAGHLAVLARTTAMHYKGTRKDIARIGRELSLDYVVEGSAWRAGDRVNLNVQLIRVRDEAHVFAKRYEADAVALFALQRSVATAITEHAGVVRAGAGAGAASAAGRRRTPTSDPVAYGRYILHPGAVSSRSR